MTSVPPLAREAIELARAGDFEGALGKATAALAEHPGDGGLRMFAGLLYSRLLQLPQAVEQFRVAVELAPTDPAARIELIRALLATGGLDEAEGLIARGGLPAREADRLQAGLLIARGDFARAAPILEALVRADPQDFESWNHLGAASLSTGQARRAMAAFDESLNLRPEQAAIWDKWVDAAMAAGDGEAALARLAADQAVPAARLLDGLDRPDEAIRRLEEAVAVDRPAVGALVALADMLERRNRIDDLDHAVARIEQHGPASERLPLLRAKLALRRNQFASARDLAGDTPDVIDPGTRWQIIGEASDRLGDHRRAWDAYRAMNAEDARANVGGRGEAEAYLVGLARETEALFEAWAAAWPPVAPPPTSPIVLLGFPRSGTTLLDTFLGAHPALRISEEYPLLPTVAHAAGPVAEIPRLDVPRIAGLRTLYWSTAERYLPDLGGLRLVDKYPFGLVAAPYVERLFPQTPMLFVERHPCDVVLSCYFTRFQPVGPPAAFVDLELTARLYDAMMRFWSRSRALLDLNVLDVRYERMIDDTAGELRAVAAFLELPFVADMTENRAAAERRGHIKTPSYAQVAEPVYRRSVERWRNYENELAPVLPILEPWAKAMGYTL